MVLRTGSSMMYCKQTKITENYRRERGNHLMTESKHCGTTYAGAADTMNLEVEQHRTLQFVLKNDKRIYEQDIRSN